ncbi:MAG TPA: MOSC domain-containing protein [Candidatus Competibacter sp.]|nr:MOSC domain-containing protein [Candidatus Competibacteraceae bacterium]HRC72862.1 MOSC domain-containing protein [Candidatus Competibacter sp.]
MWTVDGLFIGEIRIMEATGHRTGLFKEPVERATVQRLGLVGDYQADRRYHGGPEKAVHHYAPDHYARIAARFPAAAIHAAPGGLGENLSSTGMTERTVCVGDRYRLGDNVELEVSQPRTPCSKINQRFGEDDLAHFVLDERITGWYYRVIQEGAVERGAPITLQARPNPELTLDYFWTVVNQHRPDPQELQALADAVGLTESWVKRLHNRVAFLERS